MLEATLVNMDGKRAIVTVDHWHANVPPQILELESRRFENSWIGWEPPEAGQPCRATYREINPSRIINITGHKMKPATTTVTPAQAEAQLEDAIEGEGE